MQDQDVAALSVGGEAFAADEIGAWIVEFVPLGLVALLVINGRQRENLHERGQIDAAVRFDNRSVG